MTIPPDIAHRLAAQRASDLRAEAREHRLADASMPSPPDVRPRRLRPSGARLLLALARRLDTATVTARVPELDAWRR